MNFLTRLWPFRGGDVATVRDEDFVSVPPRHFRPSTLVTAPEHPFVLIPPIPVADSRPGPEDCDHLGRCWCFCPDAWTHNESVPDPDDSEHLFVRKIEGPQWSLRPLDDLQDTCWLPASVEVLPARCCPPEVHP